MHNGSSNKKTHLSDWNISPLRATFQHEIFNFELFHDILVSDILSPLSFDGVFLSDWQWSSVSYSNEQEHFALQFYEFSPKSFGKIINNLINFATSLAQYYLTEC